MLLTPPRTEDSPYSFGEAAASVVFFLSRFQFLGKMRRCTLPQAFVSFAEEKRVEWERLFGSKGWNKFTNIYCGWRRGARVSYSVYLHDAFDSGNDKTLFGSSETRFAAGRMCGQSADNESISSSFFVRDNLDAGIYCGARADTAKCIPLSIMHMLWTIYLPIRWCYFCSTLLAVWIWNGAQFWK